MRNLSWGLFGLIVFLGLCPGQAIFRAQNVTSGGGGGGSWSLVQVFSAGYESGSSDLQCSGTDCTLSNIPTTGSGHVLVLMVGGGQGNGATISSVSGGGTWSTTSSCNQTGGGVQIDLTCAYTLSSSATTSITVTLSAAGGAGTIASLWEYSWSGSAVAFDNAGVATADSLGTSHDGVTPSLTGSSDVIVQSIGLNTSTVTGVTVYGNVQDDSTIPETVLYWGSADLENTTSTTIPVWTSNVNATAIRSYIAIKGS